MKYRVDAVIGTGSLDEIVSAIRRAYEGKRLTICEILKEYLF